MLTVAGCDNGTYDGILAIYSNYTGTCECPPADCMNDPDGPYCDNWQEWYQIACSDDTCGVGGGMPIVEELYLMPHQCYLIRMGGWDGDQGTGELDIFVEWIWYPNNVGPPLPEDCARLDPAGPNGWGNRCQDLDDSGYYDKPPWCCSDYDCRDESICVFPWAPGYPPTWSPYTFVGDGDVYCCSDGTICSADNGGQPCPDDCDVGHHAGVCYAPKTRYLSVTRRPEGTRTATAMRVSLVHDWGAPHEDPVLQTLGWFGEPTWVDPPGAPAGLCVSRIQAVPHYEDYWKCAEDDGSAYLYPPYYVVHGYGCEIAHASLCADMLEHCHDPVPCSDASDCVHYEYCVQSIFQGQDTGGEWDYSECLRLTTAPEYGDTVSNCGGNVCRPPDYTCGLSDIMAAIFYFQGNFAAPMVWVDIAPSTGNSTPDQNIGLGDIMAAIGGFQGQEYPGNGPLDCP